MEKQREIWVDNVKVIACILVVLGHFFQSMTQANILSANDVYQWFNQTIYYFHVPLFFICSGYLYQKLSVVDDAYSWGRNIMKKLLVLGVPYFAFSFVTWALKTLFSSSVNNEIGGLGDTLMQKIATKNPAVVSLLTTQYRMREEIMGFSSNWFYQGQLKAAPEVSHRGILRIDSPLEWIDTSLLDIPEEEQTENGSRINQAEAQIAIRQLHDYIEKIGKDRILDERIDFGVISPYKAQVQYLRQLIRRDAFFRPLRELITIHTVDGFQGQERDVILISLVRANERGRIGFLNDLRRMNVAITRARMKLLILGDSATIARHQFYAALYDYIQQWGKITRIQPEKEE